MYIVKQNNYDDYYDKIYRIPNLFYFLVKLYMYPSHERVHQSLLGGKTSTLIRISSLLTVSLLNKTSSSRE